MPETLGSRAHHKIKTGSPGSEVVTLQQFLEESNKLTSIQVSNLNLGRHYKLNFYDWTLELFLKVKMCLDILAILYHTVYYESKSMAAIH